MAGNLSQMPRHDPDKAMAWALRLAHAENALRMFTSGQVDAIIDPDGKTYLLRPAQEELQKNEKRLQTLIDSIADVITVVNRRGEVLSQNNAAHRVIDYRPEELVGSSIFSLVHPDDLTAVHSAFFNVVEEIYAHSRIQFRHRDRDGSYRFIEATIGKLQDSASTSVVFSLRPGHLPLLRHPEATPLEAPCSVETSLSNNSFKN